MKTWTAQVVRLYRWAWWLGWAQAAFCTVAVVGAVRHDWMVWSYVPMLLCGIFGQGALSKARAVTSSALSQWSVADARRARDIVAGVERERVAVKEASR